MGYNAYSVIQTGKDVYGKSFPLFFQALDDYKPGLVFYTSMPAILIFGLNDFAVRFSPFIIGFLSLGLIFILAKLLYPKSRLIPYVSITLFAFAPWHIALSRAMVWYIELLFLYLLFLICFFFCQKKYINYLPKTTLLMLSSIFLSLTLYVYYAAIIYLPLMLLVNVYLARGFVRENLKIFLVATSIFIILSLPAISHYSKKESRTRLNVISILTADVTLPTSIQEIKQDKQAEHPVISQIMHNRRIIYTSAFLDNYFDYFRLDYLFVNSNNIRYFYINNVGLFYLIELPFVLYGLYILVKRRDAPDLLILALLVIGPVPAALTLGSPLPHRALLTIFSLQLISTIGVTTFLSKMPKKLNLNFQVFKLTATRYMLISCLITIYAASTYFFLHQYFIHSPKEFTSENDNGAWFSTVRDILPKINQEKTKYDRIIFTWAQPKLVPPIYYLFYNKIDPRIIQKKASSWTNEPPSHRQIYNQINNIEFRPIDWEKDKDLKNTLFVGYPKEFTTDVNVIGKTYLPNGNEHFLLVGNN